MAARSEQLLTSVRAELSTVNKLVAASRKQAMPRQLALHECLPLLYQAKLKLRRLTDMLMAGVDELHSDSD